MPRVALRGAACAFILLFTCHLFYPYGPVKQVSPRDDTEEDNTVQIISLTSNVNKPRLVPNGSRAVNESHNPSLSGRFPQGLQDSSFTTISPEVTPLNVSKKNPTPVPDHFIGTQESHPRKTIMSGYLFGPDGVMDTRMHEVKTVLVHEFSAFIDAEARTRMLDPYSEAKHCILSPAIEQVGDDIITAFRIFKCPHKIETSARTQIQKDLVFVQKYDRKLQPKGYGYFLGFGYSRFSNQALWDGPQDPRAFKVNNTVYLTFHAAVYLKESGDQAIQQAIIWDFEQNRPRIPQLRNNPMHKSDHTSLYDKNWMALNVGEKLYFIQALDPLLVISCNLNASCHYINDVTNVDYPFNWHTVLRGGSQFQLYRWPYYIGAVHSLYRMNWNQYVYRAYGAHLVVLSMPNFRFVYSSDLLRLNNRLYTKATRPITFISDFFFPTSLIVESNDTILIGGHINDDNACLIRAYGIEKLMEDVMKRDLQLNPHGQKPKTNVIQSFFQSHFSQYYTEHKVP